MNDLFSTHQDQAIDWGMLLVDAADLFNFLNWAAMLLHACVLWPCCNCFLFNTYSGWSVPMLRSSLAFLYSKEGAAQGDPLSMFIYAAEESRSNISTQIIIKVNCIFLMLKWWEVTNHLKILF